MRMVPTAMSLVSDSMLNGRSKRRKTRYRGLQSAFFRLSKAHSSHFPKFHGVFLVSKAVRGIANLVKSLANWLL